MIVARLSVEGEGSDRHLVGRTVCNWQHAIGTRVLVKRDGDEWVIIELGPRETRQTPQGVLSFVEE